MTLTPPTGTVTYLFTNIEGSTKLALAHPVELESVGQHLHAMMGDAFCVAFSTASGGQEDALVDSWQTALFDSDDIPIMLKDQRCLLA